MPLSVIEVNGGSAGVLLLVLLICMLVGAVTLARGAVGGVRRVSKRLGERRRQG